MARALRELRLAAPFVRAHRLTDFLDHARREIGPEIDGIIWPCDRKTQWKLRWA
jgi:hypothetical protein